MCKFRCRNNHLSISQSRFIDETLVGADCICPLCPCKFGDDVYRKTHHNNIVLISTTFLSFILFGFFAGERQKNIGNDIAYPNYLDIYQVQNSLNSVNYGELKNIAQFVDLIMKIFEQRHGWDITFDWITGVTLYDFASMHSLWKCPCILLVWEYD